jgi:hypothetical protein
MGVEWTLRIPARTGEFFHRTLTTIACKLNWHCSVLRATWFIGFKYSMRVSIESFKRIWCDWKRNTTVVRELWCLSWITLVPVAARPTGLVCGRSLVGIVVRNPPRAWIFLSFECIVLSGRCLCDGSVSRPWESYRGCVVCVSLSVIRCYDNPLRLKWVGISQTKKKKKENWIRFN